MIGWVPGVVDEAGSARHFPEWGFHSCPSESRCYSWEVAPVQSDRMIGVLFAVPPPETVMHLWSMTVLFSPFVASGVMVSMIRNSNC